MRIPPKNSRGRKVLLSLLDGPVTLHQGMERHGDLGFKLEQMRSVYEQLVLDECATFNGLIYTVTIRAQDQLAPPAPDDSAPPVVASQRYQADWRATTLNATSARRRGAAYGFVPVRLQSGVA